jgi:hypothetical protein
MSTVAHGYHLVRALNENGRPVAVRRHTLVAETYHGPKPAGKQVRHLDGNPANDHYKNLRWGTMQENCNDTVRHGRTTRGKRNSQAKITEQQAREIKQRLRAGESGSELAVEFNLSQPAVSNIKTGATWSWLE